jgi:hypothetical protein
MKHHLLAVFLGLAWAAQAAVTSVPEEAEPDWFDRYVARRLEVGTRLTHIDILDERHSNGHEFLNHITELDEDQDHVPNRLFVDYWLTRSFGLELAMGGLEADMVNEGPEHSSDGSIELGGAVPAGDRTPAQPGRVDTLRRGGAGLPARLHPP